MPAYRVWAELTSGPRAQIGYVPSYDDAQNEIAAALRRIKDGEGWMTLPDGLTTVDARAVVAFGVSKDDGMPMHPISTSEQRWAVSTD